MSLILRVPKNLHTQFKEYCTSKDTTMSSVLIDYITTTVNGKAKVSVPAEKKSVEKSKKVRLLQCPHCGKDYTNRHPMDFVNHKKKCEKLHNVPFS